MELESDTSHTMTSVKERISRIQKKMAEQAEVSTPPSSPKACQKVHVLFPSQQKGQEMHNMVLKVPDSPSTVSSTSFSSLDDFLPSLSSGDAGGWVGSERGHTRSPASDLETSPFESLTEKVCLIQSTIRRFLCQKQFQRKQEMTAMDAKERRNLAAIQIQAVFRSWYCRMTQRVAMLEKRLARSQRKKERTLQWIEAKKKNEMEEFHRRMIKTEKRRTSLIVKSHQIMEKLRTENKMIREENKKLAKEIDVQLELFAKQKKIRDTCSVSTAMLRERLPSLEAENRAATNASAVLEQHVADLTASLAVWDETLEYEKKVRRMTKTLAQNVLKEVEKSGGEDPIFSQEIGTSLRQMLKTNDSLKKSLKRGARKSLKKTNRN